MKKNFKLEKKKNENRNIFINENEMRKKKKKTDWNYILHFLHLTIVKMSFFCQLI